MNRAQHARIDRQDREIASLVSLYNHCGHVAQDAETSWAQDSSQHDALRNIRDQAMKARDWAAQRLNALGYQV